MYVPLLLIRNSVLCSREIYGIKRGTTMGNMFRRGSRGAKTIWKASFRQLGAAAALAVIGLAAVPNLNAKTWTLQSGPAGVRLTLSTRTGRYRVVWLKNKWTYQSSGAKPAIDVNQSTIASTLGKASRLTWKEPGSAARYSATLYPQYQAIVFSAANQRPGSQFPRFTRVPRGLLHLGLNRQAFTPPQFHLLQTATPWVFFNRQLQTCIFAPASEIMVSKLYRSRYVLADGFNPGTTGLALKQSHQTILIFGNGIRHTIAVWGKTFRELHHRPATPQDASPVLRDFGYWTDNGAHYFYNYNEKYGYTGTLLRMAAQFRHDHIHLGYMELDSWWYQKSLHFFNGHPLGPMNRNLPVNNRWNHFGGIWRYEASRQLFPHGLDAFHHQLGLPLVVHTRWIARHSPYHKQFRISGIAAADRRYWKSRAQYLNRSGVRVMEEDWLNDIYANSPQLHVHLSLARDFTHGMADAMSARHIAIIYCMETSRFLMEAAELPDVIAMRGADDRFVKARWRNFIFNSMFIHAVGAWPWSDVFMSSERGNMLLSVLSGGPVGVGDQLGAIDPTYIDMATRADGRLVKPVIPLMPTDATVVNEAVRRNIPLVATTYTGHGIKNPLVFIFRRSGDQSSVTLTPQSLGLDPHGVWIARKYFTGQFAVFDAHSPINVKLGIHKWAYWILAPILPSHIAFFGDLHQMVPTGSARIADLASLRGVHSGISMHVIFAMSEKTVPLTFYSFHTPSVIAAGQALTPHELNTATHLYRVNVPVKVATHKTIEFHKAVRYARVLIMNSSE